MKLKPLIYYTNKLYIRWREHGLILILYFILSVGLTWPLIDNFPTSLIGAGGDAKHHLWILWHTKQAIFEQESLFYTPYLYYPAGISLLLHSLGPLSGILTLPFWAWSPEAAYNGMVLIGFVFTGYFMYLFARSFNFNRQISIFAGIVLLTAKIHLVGVPTGHLGQTFMGMFPLSLLTLRYSLNLERSYWWTIVTGCILFLTLLYSGRHFVFACIAVGSLIILTLFTTDKDIFWKVFWRGVLTTFSTLVFTVPLLLSILSITNQLSFDIRKNLDSQKLQPDLLQLFIPPENFLTPIFNLLVEPINGHHETVIYIPWIVVILSCIAILKGNKSVKRWSFFSVFFVILSLGPTLKFMGESTFTDYELPIILPYAFITSLPGLNFIRTPGRFMMVGFVGLSVISSFGLNWLHTRTTSDKKKCLITLTIISLLLVENYPKPWSQENLRPLPEFYKLIAHEPEIYGVFDLPIRPYKKRQFNSWYVYYSSYYQMYQKNHKKGIHSGYISRVYTKHPMFPHVISDEITYFPYQKNIFINQGEANRYLNMEYDLASYNYRYVVFHKPQKWYQDYQKGSWGEKQSQIFIQEVFKDKKPIVDDELTMVYEVSPITDTSIVKPNLVIHGQEPWTKSPAYFYLYSPEEQQACLEITLNSIQNYQNSESFDSEELLMLQSSNGLSVTTQLIFHNTITIPLLLQPGRNTLTMTVGDRGTDRVLGIDWINLQTEPRDMSSPDSMITVNNKYQPTQLCGYNFPILAFAGSGWYSPEATDWRWASSVAELLLHSPVAKDVTVELIPTFLNDPNNQGQSTQKGNLNIKFNGWSSLSSAQIQVNQLFTTTLALQSGLNTLTLSLESGNFRPSDLDPNSGDSRLLSFAVSKINMITEEAE